MNADMVTVNIVRRTLFKRWIELESDAVLQFAEKTISSPSVPQEEELQARALAVFAQDVGVAEEFGHALDHRHNLIPADERVQARAEIGLCRKSTGNSQGETNLGLAANRAGYRGQSNVVDFRIRAPHGASGDGDLELAREIVEVGIP